MHIFLRPGQLVALVAAGHGGQPMMLTPEAAEHEILDRLSSATTPLKKSQLVIGTGKTVREKALKRLASSGQVVNLGSKSRPAFVAGPVDLIAYTEQLILQLAPVKPAPLSLFKLRKSLPYKQLQDHVITAAGRLVEKKEAIVFKLGAITCLLHLGPIRTLFDATPPAQSFVPSSEDPRPSSPLELASTLITAYRDLVRLMGTPNVPIASLVQSSRLPLASVLDWLTVECFAHRAVPSHGEPSLATPEERAAALVIRGEAYFLIRILA